MQMLLDNFFYYQSYLKIATQQTAAGACTTCFEWAHLSLELEWHEELLVTFRASPIFPNYSPPCEMDGAQPLWSPFARTGMWCSEAGRENARSCHQLRQWGWLIIWVWKGWLVFSIKTTFCKSIFESDDLKGSKWQDINASPLILLY